MCQAADQARLDVLSIAVQEVLRLVLPQHAAVVAQQLRERVGSLALTAPMSEEVDEAIAAESSALLGALGCC
jgi:hypothetical protein